MEEARAVLARLERIETLERDGAGVPSLLAELRELVREATEWAERERDPGARAAAAALVEAGSHREAGCRHGLLDRGAGVVPGGGPRGALAGYGLVRLRLVAVRARVVCLRARLRFRQEPAGQRAPSSAARLRGRAEARSSTWGAIDFSNTTFSNSDILAALKRAADGYHNCHVRGSVDILYGNSNYHMSDSGMSNTDAWYAGYHQSERSEDLVDYQTSKGYDSQTSDAASDMEPSWDGELITKQLVNGDAGQGWALYYDFGSADGCPQSGSSDGPCNNGWHASDVGYVSFHGLAISLPEIYYSALANQWTVVRKLWNGDGDYFFAGVTASTGVGLTPAAAWNTFNSLNSGLVDSEIACFGC